MRKGSRAGAETPAGPGNPMVRNTAPGNPAAGKAATGSAAVRPTLLALALAWAGAFAVAGCGIRPRSAVPDADVGRIITAQDVADSEATTMWEALRRTVRYVRFQESGTGDPERVHRRGASSIVLADDARVYIDGVRVRDLTVLASLPANDIERIQVLTGVHATTYYGTNAGDGVILIRTRDPGGAAGKTGPP